MGNALSYLRGLATGALRSMIGKRFFSEDQTITAENFRRLLKDTSGYLEPSKKKSNTAMNNDLIGYDKKQTEAMQEVCILVDTSDKPFGGVDKYTCHRMSNIKRGLLHRAFSVFLFDSQNRLLLQQRANDKVTYPDMWTNTCCSHPLNYPIEGGVNLEDAVLGVKRAAVRKLWDELWLESAREVPEELLGKFEFLTRIIYKAVNVSPSDKTGEEKWGEHEIDYILFLKADLDHTPNPKEAKATRYVTQDELRTMLEDKTLNFTPWFKLICETQLYKWWDRLTEGKDLTSRKEKNEIIQMLD